MSVHAVNMLQSAYECVLQLCWNFTLQLGTSDKYILIYRKYKCKLYEKSICMFNRSRMQVLRLL